MKQIKQPRISKGYEFIGWATFNWGICHKQVYRTRKEAIESLIRISKQGSTWNDIKDHFKVEKVKCVII